MFGHHRQFAHRVNKSAVAADRDDPAARLGHRGADCGRQTEAHGIKLAGLQQTLRSGDVELVANPQPVIADVARNQHVTVKMPVERLQHIGGAHAPGRIVFRREAQWLFSIPRRTHFDFALKCRQQRRGITLHGQIDRID